MEFADELSSSMHMFHKSSLSNGLSPEFNHSFLNWLGTYEHPYLVKNKNTITELYKKTEFMFYKSLALLRFSDACSFSGEKVPRR
jgi:hypothetical protein